MARVDDAPRLAELHCARIEDGFLSSLGPRFLAHLYRRVARSARAFAIVAESEGEVVAFCAVAQNVRRFYGEFLAHEGIIAAGSSAIRITRRLPHVVETLRYGVSSEDLPNAEILAIAADASVAGQGFGAAVLAAALQELDRRGCADAKVVTGEANAPAIRMYRRAGFAPRSTISIHDQIPQEVLVWARS